MTTRTTLAAATVLTGFLALVGTTASAAPGHPAVAPDGATAVAARDWVDWNGTERATIRHEQTRKRMVPADWVTTADYPVRIWEGDSLSTHEWAISRAGTQFMDGASFRTYTIRNVKSNRCLQPSPVLNDVRIWQVTCSQGSGEQQWILPDAKYGGRDDVQILPAWRPHLALVPQIAAANPSDLVLRDRDNSAEQVWRIEH
ncbi:RICIN domain-containing protein [Saccharopolyspora sp. 5N708]|uniref:RICIN domain-containing protein n=1 Tax=Saccharopolyspora sp. 5N708 TaxID=3457424 RepID=UPI003FD25EAD